MRRSHAFTEVMKQVDRVANTNLTVLLTGESGTGKEFVASAIHHRSGRADKPFIAINCDALSDELSSLWEKADGGTVFLDEITETTPSFQEKMLCALQTGAGSQRVNVRVIAASNRNVQQEVAAGRFHKDLYSHLNAASIELPPLREHSEDITPLAQSFADRVYSFNPPVKFSTEALELLERYHWPGNIRELEHAVVRAVAMCDGTIRVEDLPQRVRNSADLSTGPGGTTDEPQKEEWVPLSEIEGRYVAQVLTHTRGNKQAAARVLAVDRKTLNRMIKRHHIDSEQARRAGR